LLKVRRTAVLLFVLPSPLLEIVFLALYQLLSTTNLILDEFVVLGAPLEW
jgi:hypothetical protein